MENLGVVVRLQDLREVLPVGVGNENLSELFALYHIYDTFYTFAVQSVEDIIQQQDRCFTRHICQVQSLCQFHRQHESALLTLAAHLLERIVAKTHIEIYAGLVRSIRG